MFVFFLLVHKALTPTNLLIYQKAKPFFPGSGCVTYQI